MSDVSRYATCVYIYHVQTNLSGQLILRQVIHLMSDVSRHATGEYILCVKYVVWTTDLTTGHTLDVRCKYTCY